MKRIDDLNELKSLLPKYEKGKKSKVFCPKCRSNVHTYLTYIHGSVKFKYEATFCQICETLWLTGEQLSKKMKGRE